MGAMIQTAEYFINPDTMMISPKRDSNGNLHSVIREVKNIYEIDRKPKRVMIDGCHYYGSDFNGQKTGTRMITNYCKKVPICIDRKLEIFALPLESDENDTCIWLIYEHIDQLFEAPLGTMVVFSNKEQVVLPYNKGSLQSKIERTARLKSILLKRL